MKEQTSLKRVAEEAMGNECTRGIQCWRNQDRKRKLCGLEGRMEKA